MHVNYKYKIHSRKKRRSTFRSTVLIHMSTEVLKKWSNATKRIWTTILQSCSHCIEFYIWVVNLASKKEHRRLKQWSHLPCRKLQAAREAQTCKLKSWRCNPSAVWFKAETWILRSLLSARSLSSLGAAITTDVWEGKNLAGAATRSVCHALI